MADFKPGSKIEIQPRLQPEAETLRQKTLNGKDEQKSHQLNSESAIVESVSTTVDGKFYLVRVFVEGRPRGALRRYPEDRAKEQFKAV